MWNDDFTKMFLGLNIGVEDPQISVGSEEIDLETHTVDQLFLVMGEND